MKKLAILSLALLTSVSVSAKYAPSYGSTISIGGSTLAENYMDAAISLYNTIFPCPTFVYKQTAEFSDSFRGRYDVYNGLLDASVSDFLAPATETRNLPDCFLQIPFILSSVSVIYNLPASVTQSNGSTYNPATCLTPAGVLRLTGEDLCRIYTGATNADTLWETYLAKPYNCNVSFSSTNRITPFARGDASGTNQAFTTYLNDCGNCTAVNAGDPKPHFLNVTTADKVYSSAEMIEEIRKTGGSIGYVGTGANLISLPTVPAALLLQGGLMPPTDNLHQNDFISPTDDEAIQNAQIDSVINNQVCNDLICQFAPHSNPGHVYPIVTAEYFDLFGTQPIEWIACNLTQFIVFLLTQGQKLGVRGFVPMTQDCLNASKILLDSIAPAICKPCVEPCIPCRTPEFCEVACPTCGN